MCASQGQCTSPSVTYQVESHCAKTDKEEISPNNYEGLVDWVFPLFRFFLFLANMIDSKINSNRRIL